MNTKLLYKSNFFPRSPYLMAFALTLCLAQTGLAQSVRQQKLTAKEIAQKASPSIVLVVAENVMGNPTAIGSGFFVKDDLIATNSHVIKGAAKIRVKLIGQDRFIAVQKVASENKERDLALLRVEGQRAKPLSLGDNTQVAVGDDIFVLGNPEGLEGTFSQGIVSAIRGQKYIQITAPISHGSSGAPVLNNRGEVIGVAVGVLEEGQNLNFAIPAMYLKALLSTPTTSLPTASNTAPVTIYGDPQSFPNRNTGSTSIDSRVNKGRAKNAELSEIARSHFARGEAHLNFGERGFADAAEAFKRAIQFEPRYVKAHIRLADTMALLEHYQEAEAIYRKAIAIDPDDAEAYNALGKFLRGFGKGRDEEALDAFKRAIQLDPNNADAYREYGLLLRGNKFKRYQEALVALKQSIKLNPDDPTSHRILGNLLIEEFHQSQEGYDELNKALKLAPNDFINFWTLCDAYLTGHWRNFERLRYSRLPL